MLLDLGIVQISRKVDERLRNFCHALMRSKSSQVFVVSIQNESSAPSYPFRHEPFNPDNVLDALNPVLTDVIGMNVGHDRNIRPVVSESGAHNAASCGF